MFLHFALPALAVFLFLTGIRKKKLDSHWASYRKSFIPDQSKQDVGIDDIILSGLDLSWDKAFLAGIAGAAVGAAAMLILTGKVWFLFPGLLVGLLVPRAWFNWKINARRCQFQIQLESTLNLMAASLRAGASEIQAWEQAALAAPYPARDVLEYVIRLNRSGRSLAVSLEEVARRTDSRELQMMAAATALCAQAGGDLAGVYDRLGDSLREKQAFRSQVEGLMAEGKMSANILAAIPFGFIALFRHLSPQYMAPLFNEVTGNIIFLVCTVLILIGWAVLRQMSRVEY